MVQGGIGRIAARRLRWLTALAAGAGSLLLWPTLLLAEGPTDTTDGYYIRSYSDLTNSAPTASWWSLTLDLVLKLAIIVVLIYITLWALRTVMARTRAAATKGKLIDVVETTHLAPNKTLHLVEVGDRLLLIGSTQSQLTTLTEITDPAVVSLLKLQTKPAEPPNFAEQLKTFSEKVGVVPTGGDVVVADAIERRVEEGRAFLGDKVAELRGLTGRLRGQSATRPSVPGPLEQPGH